MIYREVDTITIVRYVELSAMDETVPAHQKVLTPFSVMDVFRKD